MNQEKESKNRNNIKYKKKKKRVSNYINIKFYLVGQRETRLFKIAKAIKIISRGKVKYKWEKFNYLDIKILVST